ncbi:MarR family winged helix-turn-helix transcriptional regulator [Methylocaldum szegediense]|uniref:DNA-binding MarR family transcriptional regulator n=1 Tax=Methylocaldum szegediense TaxID=73780 RepID=A0ABN8X109_9GAMM|nr:MarR family winged helix-turn-helix transcriptional regulator [Methylocaldum szegediense]CAI8805892.1 DNA-binding MarR family transcriptional regulator [Methylocaldum szegediense]
MYMNTDLIYDYLERIANLIRTDVRRMGIARGLQPVQLEALHYLSRCNRYSNTPVAVADYLGLTKGTVSQTLGVLESSGLIEKQADRNDRRVVHLNLTDEGLRVVSDSIPPNVFRFAVNGLSENSRSEITASLNRVLRELQTANNLKTFGSCKTCRHHLIQDDGTRQCGLTKEWLTESDAEKICREHQPAIEDA